MITGHGRAHWVAVIGLVVSSIGATAASLLLVRLFVDLDFLNILTTFAVILVIIVSSLWFCKILIEESRRRIAKQLEIKKLQSELEFAQKARELHHDLVNHLSAVSSWIQLGAGDRAVGYIHQILSNTYPSQNDAAISSPDGLTTSLLGLIGQKLAVANQQGVSLQLQLDSEWTQVGIEDETAVRVVGNLIDNALQAAVQHEGPGQGRVEVTIAMEPSAASFRVWNNGPTIPATILTNLGPSSVPPKIHKTRGLGLYIVQKLVGEAGGQLSVESTPSGGTEVLVRFSYEPAPPVQKRVSGHP